MRLGDPAGPDELAERLERAIVAEEPALRDHHLLDQRLDLVGRAEQDPLVIFQAADAELSHPDLDPADDQPSPTEATSRPIRSASNRSTKPGVPGMNGHGSIAPGASDAASDRDLAGVDELEQPRRRLVDLRRGRGR